MSTATEIASLAHRIGDANGFAFPTPEPPTSAASSFLKADGAWEYHFETDDKWGFVTPDPETGVQTTYPGWGTLTIEPGRWAVFYRGTLAGVVSQKGGRIRWYASTIQDDYPSDLESAMYNAFAAELDALLPLDLHVDRPERNSFPSIGTEGEGGGGE